MISYVHLFVLFIYIYILFTVYIIYIYSSSSSSSSIWSIQPKCCKIGKDWVIVGQEDNISMNIVWFCMMVDSVVPDLTMLIYADLLNLCLLPAADRADGALWSALHLAGALSLGMARIGPLLQVLRRLEEWRSNNAPTISSGSLKAWKLVVWYYVIFCGEVGGMNPTSAACNSICNWILLLLLAACTGTWSRHVTYSLYLITVIGKVPQTAGKTANIGFHFSWAKPCKDCFPECAKPIK